MMNGRGVSGATAGVTVAGVAGGATLPPAAGLPSAATAVRQLDDSLADLEARHCKAALPPGCTPEQCAMKSDRQAERIAAVWAAVGAPGVAADVAFARAGGFFVGSTGCADSAGAVVAVGAGSPVTADLHPGDKSVAFARRQSTISGLVGAIQEQCAAMSSNVHARRTAFNCSSCDAAGVCSALGADPTAAGVTVSGPAGVSAEAGAAAGFAATASMAVLHDDER
jgi:hypothetical protein